MPTALITGGTSGIGAAFARELAHRGSDLVLVARDEGRLAGMAAELRSLGRDVEVLPADLADPDATDRVAARLRDQDRPVVLLVNNAGFGMRAHLVDPDLSAHDAAFAVMIRAVLVLGGSAAAAMVARGSGRILNVSSTAGWITTGNYSAIKAWVTVYTEALSNELRGTGVHAMALLPGWVRTEFHSRAGIRASSIPDALWIEAEPLVRQALTDLDHGRVLSIPTLRYRTLGWFAKHAPRSLVRSASRRISSSRREPVA